MRSHGQIRHALLVCTQATRQVDEVVNQALARTWRLHTGGHMHTSRVVHRLLGCRHTGLWVDICRRLVKKPIILIKVIFMKNYIKSTHGYN